MRIVLSLAAFLAVSPFASASVDYKLTPRPAAKTYAVAMKFPATGPVSTVRIPAWTPGFYFLESYQKEITDVKATDADGNSLKLTHPDAQSWSVQSKPGEIVTLSYSVLGDDPGLGFFGCMLGAQTGFINGASTFMYLDGGKEEPIKLSISLPDKWDLATGLSSDPSAANDTAKFIAPSGYDEFIDSPIQLGQFTRKRFTAEGIPFEVIYVSPSGRFNSNLDAETERLKKVSAPAIRMFGGAPFKHYTYIIHLAIGNFSGGLEHRASTCIAISNSSHLDLDDLAAHENFHAWNVKQIRPIVLGPFDYTKPVRSPDLWFMEGVTDYYSKILTYRSGIQDADWLMGQINDQIAELQQGKMRLSLTLEDCSRKAWENGGFGVGDLSYYTKGFLVGLILDASMRARTHGTKSLDDVMRYLYAKYRLPHPGIREGGLLEALNAVGGPQVHFDGLYRRMMQSTEELPYDILRSIGLQAEISGHSYVTPGFATQNGVITSISPLAEGAGLRVGDRFIAYEDSPWTGGPGPDLNEYRVTVQRDGQDHTLTVPYSTTPSGRYNFGADSTASVTSIALRDGWLVRGDSGGEKGDHPPVGNDKAGGQ